MRYTDGQLCEIAVKTTADSADNAAVVLPLVSDLQEARAELEAAKKQLIASNNAWERCTGCNYPAHEEATKKRNDQALEAAKWDTVRLDWLQSEITSGQIYISYESGDNPVLSIDCFSKASAREAIDAAIAARAKEPK